MRRVTLADLAFVRHLFAIRFSNYDIEAAEQWYCNVVLANPSTWLAIRSEAGFLTAYLRSFPWLPHDKTVEVITVATHPGKIWHALPLLRASIAWGRANHASAWNYQSDTGLVIRPLMRRLGALELEPRYTLNLEASR